MKTTRVQVPIESIQDRNVLAPAAEYNIYKTDAFPEAKLAAEGADWPGSPTFPSREKSSPPRGWGPVDDIEADTHEPATGMNGPTGYQQPDNGAFIFAATNEEAKMNIAAPEIPVTDEMVAAIRGRAMCAGWTDNVIAEYYRMMRAKEPIDDSWETAALAASAHEWKAERDAALARAEAAEGMILAIESNAGFYQELADKWKERARAAETRLAERDASFNRLRWRK